LPTKLAGDLDGGGRLARPLQPGEEDDGELAESEAGGSCAHQLGQLLVDDLDDLLSRREALQHLLAERPLSDAGDEVAHDLEVDVGLEQREPDLAHRTRDRFLVEPALLAEVAERSGELLGEGVEHGPPSVLSPPRRPAAKPRGLAPGWRPTARRVPQARTSARLVEPKRLWKLCCDCERGLAPGPVRPGHGRTERGSSG
jgi:hypothetical protein